MPIFICKNCGKLTETEDSDAKTCASCGAPLDSVKQDDNEEVLQARRPSAKRSAPIRLPTSPASKKPAPKKPATPAPKKPAPKKPAAPAPKKPASKKPAAPAARPQAPSVQLRPVALPEEEAEGEKPRAIAGESPTGTPGEEAYVQPQTAPGAEPESMEFYVNKDLVACPQCGYGCDPNWGKCPICEAPIAGSGDLKKVTEVEFTADESSFTKGLIPCPECQYYCDPSWGKCPICNTELGQPPEAEESETEKPKPEEPEPEEKEPE